MSATRAVRARRRHRCVQRMVGCPGWVEPGEVYLRHVMFPGHDVVVVPVPTAGAECGWCARVCRRGDLIDGYGAKR